MSRIWNFHMTGIWVWIIFVWSLWQLNFGVTNKVSRWNAPDPHRPKIVATRDTASLSRSRIFLWSGLLRNQNYRARTACVRLNKQLLIPKGIPRLIISGPSKGCRFPRQFCAVKPTFSRGGKACSPGPHGPARPKWQTPNYGDGSIPMDPWHRCWSSFWEWTIHSYNTHHLDALTKHYKPYKTI